MVMYEVVFTGIVGGLTPSQLPLGGGATVLNGLIREWVTDKNLSLTVLGPGSDVTQYPDGVSYIQMPFEWPNGTGPDALTRLSAFQYAKVARRFERATTDFLLGRARQKDPRNTCVICNDISEGVDFKRVAE